MSAASPTPPAPTQGDRNSASPKHKGHPPQETSHASNSRANQAQILRESRFFLLFSLSFFFFFFFVFFVFFDLAVI